MFTRGYCPFSCSPSESFFTEPKQQKRLISSWDFRWDFRTIFLTLFCTKSGTRNSQISGGHGKKNLHIFGCAKLSSAEYVSPAGHGRPWSWDQGRKWRSFGSKMWRKPPFPQENVNGARSIPPHWNKVRLDLFRKSLPRKLGAVEFSDIQTKSKYRFLPANLELYWLYAYVFQSTANFELHCEVFSANIVRNIKI